MGNLKKRLARLEAVHGEGCDKRLFFYFHDWAVDVPLILEPEEADDAISRATPAALDRLVAAGKITDADRERVTFIVLVPPFRPRLRQEQK